MGKETKKLKQWYYVRVCPHCHSDNYFEIKTGSDGLFTNATFSHYQCEKCNGVFQHVEILEVVPSKEIRNIIQKGMNGKLYVNEMIKELQRYGIYVGDRRK